MVTTEHMFWLTVTMMPCCLIGFYYIKDILLLVFGFDPIVSTVAGQYAKYNILWPIPNGLYQCMRFYFQAQNGKLAFPAMYNNLIFLFVNAFLNWIFVFGGPFRHSLLGGWKGYGFIGGAISITISRTLQSITYFVYMFVYKQHHLPTWPTSTTTRTTTGRATMTSTGTTTTTTTSSSSTTASSTSAIPSTLNEGDDNSRLTEPLLLPATTTNTIAASTTATDTSSTPTSTTSTSSTSYFQFLEYHTYDRTKEFLYQSIPNIGTLLFNVVGNQATTILLGKLGDVVIASSSALSTITIPWNGTLSATCTTIASVRVGYHLGQGNIQNAKLSSQLLLGVLSVIVLLVSIVFICIQQYIIQIATDDENIITVATSAVPALLISTYLNLLVTTITSGIFSGMGRPIIATILSFGFELPTSIGGLAIYILIIGNATLLGIYYYNTIASFIELLVVATILYYYSDWDYYANETRRRQEVVSAGGATASTTTTTAPPVIEEIEEEVEEVTTTAGATDNNSSSSISVVVANDEGNVDSSSSHDDETDDDDDYTSGSTCSTYSSTLTPLSGNTSSST